MLFRVLPRVGLGVLIADAEGIGYALRYGVIEPKPDALDAVADSDGYGALAQKFVQLRLLRFCSRQRKKKAEV